MSAAALSIVGLAATSLACAPSCGASSAPAPTASAPAGETVVDASSPREVESSPVPPAVDASGPRAAEPSVPPSVTASAPLGPWAGLPLPTNSTRTVDVRFEVVRRSHPDGTSSPLILSIPLLRLEREIYDDRVIGPACVSRESEEHNAVAFTCRSVDGGVRVRAYQDADELVVDVTNEGDVPPTLDGTNRFKLPADHRVKFRLQLPTEMRR